VLFTFQDFLLLNNAGFRFNSVIAFFIAIAVYVNLFVLIPRFLKKERYLLYFSSLLLLIAITASLSGAVYVYVFHFAPNNTIPDFIPSSLFSLIGIVLYVFISSAFHLFREWYALKEIEKKAAQAELAKIRAELEALKLQINPHFLFNALNSLYSVSLTDASKTPETILKLSEIMRHMLYKSDVEKTDLGIEIDYITNYLEIQKLRFEGKINIQFGTNNLNLKSQIAPLLFIHYIENCFKHVNYDESGAFIDIKIEQKNESLDFVAQNSIHADKLKIHNSIGGIGMENIKKRLIYLYPDKYQLTIKEEQNIFSVNLNLNLN